jgi:hypothetical protein
LATLARDKGIYRSFLRTDGPRIIAVNDMLVGARRSHRPEYDP